MQVHRLSATMRARVVPHLSAPHAALCSSFGHVRRVHRRLQPVQVTRTGLSTLSGPERSTTGHTSVANDVGPMDGVKIIDLTRILAGPYCSMVLGDMGADVVKVEHPVKGDDTRQWGPPFTGGESAYFLGLNRNKRSIGVDFKTAEGLEVVKALVKEADVFIENFVPGKMEQMGLGYDELNALNPGLVYVSLSGWGPTGPDANRPGYDVIASARGGLMSITGEQDGGPCKVGVALTDVCTGLFAHGAVAAALFSRTKTGRGQKIDCSLLETQVATLVNIASNYLIGGQDGRRWGTAHESIVPYQAFQTSDGHIVLGATSDSQFDRLCDALGKPDWAQDSRFSTNPLRVKNRDALVEMISDTFARESTAHWREVLDRASITNGPIQTISEVFQDPQVLHCEMVKEIEHPSAGPIKMVGFPVTYSNTPSSIRRAPPLLGQHTREVLQGLGYSEQRIDSLASQGIIN